MSKNKYDEDGNIICFVCNGTAYDDNVMQRYTSYVSKEDLKKYERFLEIIHKFKQHYNLGNFSLRQIDIYLWLAGKEYFQNKY